jgi:hypothetical protein
MSALDVAWRDAPHVIHMVDTGGITATTDQGCQSVMAAIRSAAQGGQVINGFGAKHCWVAAMANLQGLCGVSPGNGCHHEPAPLGARPPIERM